VIRKYFFAWLFAALMCAAGFAQIVPQDGNFKVNKIPWNGPYLPSTQNQLVKGENYNGYPGPIPKLFYALGLDADHPVVDFHSLAIVKRDAPLWYGMCNGWAVAANYYDEPDTIIANGVKFFVGDHKAILISIFKDTSLTVFGREDPVYGGISAESFEQVLFDRVADKGLPLIFDVDISDQVWNYPVASFKRQSVQNGDWTEVKVTVTYPSLIPLGDVRGTFLPNDIDYYYRYLTATRSSYEWMPFSQDEHPQRAWIPRENFHAGQALVTANHYYNLETYNELLALSQAENNKVDLQEPNDDSETAFPLDSELVMGSLLPGDVDYYRLKLVEYEKLLVQFKVYDGPPVYLQVLNSAGDVIQDQHSMTNLAFNIRIPYSGDFYFKITPETEGATESYYQITFPEDSGTMELTDFNGMAEPRTVVRAINTTTEPSEVGLNPLTSIPPRGSLDFEAPGEPVRIFSTGRTVWSEVISEDNAILSKKYYRDHVPRMPYIVPHLTCRNGWKTRYDLFRSNPEEPVYLQIHDHMGLVLQSAEIPFMEEGRASGGLDTLFSPEVLANGAWVSFETAQSNLLKGNLIFVNGSGIPVSIDIGSSPRFGHMRVFDLKSSDKGGTGIALVNTSGTENEIVYELNASNGARKAHGIFRLEPGQKWLTTVAALSNEPVANTDVFHVFSQFEVETLVIQLERNPEVLYGHRILSDVLDQFKETYLSIPADHDKAYYLFANYNDAPLHVLFEGYDANGVRQGRFNIDLGRALQRGEVRKASLNQIFANGVDRPDLDAITYFRVTCLQPIMALEFVGDLNDEAPLAVLPVNIFEAP